MSKTTKLYTVQIQMVEHTWQGKPGSVLLSSNHIATYTRGSAPKEEAMLSYNLATQAASSVPTDWKKPKGRKS